MKRSILIVVLILSSFVTAVAQERNQDWLSYLIIPTPECGMYWHTQSSFFDPLLSNPLFSLARLEQEQQKALNSNDRETLFRVMIDRSIVYANIDSVVTSQRLASEALLGLKDLFAKNRNAEFAYQIGRAFDRLQKDKEKEYWYQEACQIDSGHYLAHLALLKDPKWTKRSKSLIEGIINSNRDPVFRARVAYQYADRLSNMIGEYGLKDFFRIFSDIAESPPDSSATEKIILSQIKNIGTGFYHEDILRYVALARTLDPDNTAYALRYSAGVLMRLFFGAIGKASDKEGSPGGQSQDQLMEQLIIDLRPEVDKIRAQLLAIPISERELFPATYYCLSFAEYLLGEYQNALDSINQFIRRSPEDKYPYALHCGIVSALSRQEGASVSWQDQLVSLSKSKCAIYPTGWDCYRLGVLWHIQGYIQDSQDAFTSAAQLDPEDLRPRLALVVCALKLGEMNRANNLIKALQESSKNLGGENLACLHLLRGVMAAQVGDLAAARYWAKQAQDMDVEIPEVAEFFRAINSQ